MIVKIILNEKNDLVLIGMFSFFKKILEFLQVLFHSCLPFLDFSSQVIHFYKLDQTYLIETYLRF